MQGSVKELTDFFMIIRDELEFEGYKVKDIQQEEEEEINKVVLTLSKGEISIKVTMVKNEKHEEFYMLFVETKSYLVIKDYDFESGDNLFDVINYEVEEIDKKIKEVKRQEEFRDLLTEQWRVFNG